MLKLIAIFFASMLIFGCAGSPPEPVTSSGFPEYGETRPPFGYVKHCIDYPWSIFCEQPQPDSRNP